MGTQSIHRCLQKREQDGELTHTDRRGEGGCEDGGRDWSDMATSEGMLAATGNQKRYGTEYSPAHTSDSAQRN